MASISKGNPVRTTLQKCYAYLRDKLSIDNDLAAKLFGWDPQLLDGTNFDEIRALNDHGKHFDAFQKWYHFAESWYTEERLEVFCECLEELGKDAKPRLFEVAKEIRKLSRESLNTHDIPGPVDRPQGNTQKSFTELCCAQCNTPITEKQFIFSMSVDGPLATHMNPAGYVHDVLTVSNAKNFNLLGLSSTEFSWFPGYAWTMLTCRVCHSQLGWRFDACRKSLKPSQFFGLTRAALDLFSLEMTGQ